MNETLLHARSSRLNKALEDSLATTGLRHQITRSNKGRTRVVALLNQAPRRHITTLILFSQYYTMFKYLCQDIIPPRFNKTYFKSHNVVSVGTRDGVRPDTGAAAGCVYTYQRKAIMNLNTTNLNYQYKQIRNL